MTVPTIFQLGAYAAGLALVLPGVWLVLHRPDPDEVGEREPQPAADLPARLRGMRDRLSAPTRTVLGFCLILLGYHLAAWAGPESAFPLRIPPDRWWLLVGGVIIAVIGSVGADRLEAR